jgi:NTP pyrophosphatase (non-canonical NTP hydrolase)
MTAQFSIITTADGFIVSEKDESGLQLYHGRNSTFSAELNVIYGTQFTDRGDAVKFIQMFDPEFEPRQNATNDTGEEIGLADMAGTQSDRIIFEDMVANLKKSGQDIIDSMIPEKADAIHMAIGVVGEAGELIDAVKKWTIYNKALDRKNVIEELGDIEFFLEGLRQIFGITRQETLEGNIEKLGKRYAEGKYSDAQAHARKDKIEDLPNMALEVIDHVPDGAIDVTNIYDLAERKKRFMIEGKEYHYIFNGTHPNPKDDGQAVS